MLSQPVFQFYTSVGFFVAVLYDDWGVEREIPFGGGAFLHGARAGDDYCIFRDLERRFGGGAVDFAFHQIIERSGACQDCACAQDSTGAD